MGLSKVELLYLWWYSRWVAPIAVYRISASQGHERGRDHKRRSRRSIQMLLYWYGELQQADDADEKYILQG